MAAHLAALVLLASLQVPGSAAGGLWPVPDANVRVSYAAGGVDKQLDVLALATFTEGNKGKFVRCPCR